MREVIISALFGYSSARKSKRRSFAQSLRGKRNGGHRRAASRALSLWGYSSILDWSRLSASVCRSYGNWQLFRAPESGIRRRRKRSSFSRSLCKWWCRWGQSPYGKDPWVRARHMESSAEDISFLGRMGGEYDFPQWEHEGRTVAEANRLKTRLVWAFLGRGTIARYVLKNKMAGLTREVGGIRAAFAVLWQPPSHLPTRACRNLSPAVVSEDPVPSEKLISCDEMK